jgi:hypothetical protein
MPLHRRHLLRLAGAAGALPPALPGSPPPAKTILLRSGWDTVNIGDIGHTPGTLRILERHLPDARILVWLARTDDRVTAMLRRRFPQVEFLTGSFATAQAPMTPSLAAAFAQADVVIQNSGMMADSRLFAVCREMGKRYGLYGQSYFEDFPARPGNLELLSAASFIYCRDTVTLSTLRKAGVRSPVLDFGPDGCFGVDVRDEAPALDFMRRHGLAERRFLTIELRTNTPKNPNVITNAPLDPMGQVGVPTAADRAADERRAAVYRDVMAAWIRKTGMKILIAPEVEKEIGHNRRLLYDPLPADLKPYVVNCERFWNLDEAASVFARARIVLCHEPHSPIIAMANGTPILHTYSIEHGPKAFMFRDIGVPEWLLDMDAAPAAGMAAALFDIHDRYGEALLKVRRAMNVVEDKWASSTSVIRRLLDSA